MRSNLIFLFCIFMAFECHAGRKKAKRSVANSQDAAIVLKETEKCLSKVNIEEDFRSCYTTLDPNLTDFQRRKILQWIVYNSGNFNVLEECPKSNTIAIIMEDSGMLPLCLQQKDGSLILAKISKVNGELFIFDIRML